MTPPTPHVLVADDHRLFAEGIARILKEAGYLVTVVTEFAAVEPTLDMAVPDLLLLDVSFGKDSALPLLRRLRDDRPALPVLVLTALNEGVIMDAVARAGAGFLSKSESPEAMVNAVDLALSGRPFRHSKGVVQVSSQKWVGGVLLTRRQVAVLRGIYEGVIVDAVARAGAGFLSKSESPEAMVNAVDLALSGRPFRHSKGVVQVSSQKWVGGVLLTRRQVAVLRGIYEGKSTSEIASALNVTLKSVDPHIRALRERIGVRSRAELVRWAGSHIDQLGD